MIATLALVAVAGSAPACVALTPGSAAWPATESVLLQAQAVESLREQYESGVGFGDFLEVAVGRRAQWLENWDRASVPAELLARARAVPGTWRILAVSLDSCSDSVSTIPFIAKLVEQVSSLDMRIIDPAKGRPIMEAHRTPDDRAATPTLLLIDDAWNESGCWVERPAVLQTWFLEKQNELPQRRLVEQKMEWYREDAGAETLREIVEMMEAAAAGTTVCTASARNSGT